MKAAGEEELTRLREAALASLRRRLVVMAAAASVWELWWHAFYRSLNMEAEGVDAVLRFLGAGQGACAFAACALLAGAWFSLERVWLAGLRFDAVRRFGRGVELLGLALVLRLLVPLRQLINDAGHADLREQSNLLAAMGALAVAVEVVRSVRRPSDRNHIDPAG